MNFKLGSNFWAHQVSLFLIGNHPQYHLPLINVKIWFATENWGGVYIRLAAWSMFTSFAMTCNLSRGTFSQMLNASISLLRISLPGFDVIYLNGSSKVWWNPDFSLAKKLAGDFEITCSSSADHLGSVDKMLRISSYFDIAELEIQKIVVGCTMSGLGGFPFQ